MNNFYASVECMLDPVLKKYPVAVCGSVEERHGIVLAKNYAAKAFGIKTGDAVWQAKQKCRNLVVVPPHFEEYIKYSKLARNVYQRYTDQVEPYGMDECWLDISGTDYTFGSPEKVANDIRETIKFELGLTISVGVSFNKIFAKLGSDMKKPDAVTVIPKDTFRDKIWGLPAADLLGVGRATQRVLDMPFLFGKKQTSPFMKRQPTQGLEQISYESCPIERIASLSCGTAQSGSSKGKSSMSFWKEHIQSNNQRCDSQNRIVVPNGGYRYPKAKRK